MVALAGIRYSLGDAFPLEEIPALTRRPDVLYSLKEKGLVCCSVTTKRPTELALKSARETLNVTRISGSDLDAVIYATTSFSDKSFYSERDVAWLMHSLGASRAFGTGTFFPGCANAVSALRVAANLVRAEGMSRILVIIADKADPSSEEARVMWPDISVLSDASVSFVVTDGCVTEFEVMAIRQYSSPAMWDMDYNRNQAAFFLETAKGAAHAARETLAELGLVPEECAALITNNYNRPVMEMIARRCGFESDQVYFDNVPRLAHAFAADTIINLADLISTHGVAGHDPYFLLATGHKNWGSVVLRGA